MLDDVCGIGDGHRDLLAEVGQVVAHVHGAAALEGTHVECVHGTVDPASVVDPHVGLEVRRDPLRPEVGCLHEQVVTRRRGGAFHGLVEIGPEAQVAHRVAVDRVGGEDRGGVIGPEQEPEGCPGVGRLGQAGRERDGVGVVRRGVDPDPATRRVQRLEGVALHVHDVAILDHVQPAQSGCRHVHVDPRPRVIAGHELPAAGHERSVRSRGRAVEPDLVGDPGAADASRRGEDRLQVIEVGREAWCSGRRGRRRRRHGR